MLVKNPDLIGAMKTLGTYCVNPHEELTDTSFTGNMRIVDFDGFLTPEGKRQSLVYHGKSLEVYEKICALLSNEPNAEHLSTKEIEDAIIRFTKEIILNKDQFRNMGKLKIKVEETLSTLLKPFESWFVIAPFEGLQTELKEIKIGDYFITKFELEDISKYLVKPKSDFEKMVRKNFVGKYCIFVTVDSNNAKSAVDKGKRKINEILHLLRAFFGSYFYTRIATPEAFLSINKPGTLAQFTLSYRHEERCHIDDKNKKELFEYLQKMQGFVKSDNPSKINRRILRALRWLGMAVQDEVSEDKIIKYCTALETLLITEKEGKKGELLAYRIALLQNRLKGEMTDPDNTLGFYEKRSQIVHGDDYEKDTLIEKFALNVEYLTRSTLIHFCEAIQQNNIKSIGEFVKWLEQDDEKTKGVQSFIANYCDPLLQKYVQGKLKPKSAP